MPTKQEIINIYDNLRDCALAEWEIGQEESAIKQRKIAAHKLTQLARSALSDLETN